MMPERVMKRLRGDSGAPGSSEKDESRRLINLETTTLQEENSALKDQLEKLQKENVAQKERLERLQEENVAQKEQLERFQGLWGTLVDKVVDQVSSVSSSSNGIKETECSVCFATASQAAIAGHSLGVFYCQSGCPNTVCGGCMGNDAFNRRCLYCRRDSLQGPRRRPQPQQHHHHQPGPRAHQQATLLSTAAGLAAPRGNSIAYAPGSVPYNPTSPAYVPSAPVMYDPTEPVYTPTDPVRYNPTSPAHGPTAPVYDPTEPAFPPIGQSWVPYNLTSPAYRPRPQAPQRPIFFREYDPLRQEYVNRPDSPRFPAYSPRSPAYSPASRPAYSPVAPEYVPPSRADSAQTTAPAYSPVAPEYVPTAPAYTPDAAPRAQEENRAAEP